MSGGIVTVVVVNVVAWMMVRAGMRFLAHRLPNRWLGVEVSNGYSGAQARARRRSELGHWLAVLTAPLFFLWSPWYAATVVHVYAVGSRLYARPAQAPDLKMVSR